MAEAEKQTSKKRWKGFKIPLIIKMIFYPISMSVDIILALLCSILLSGVILCTMVFLYLYFSILPETELYLENFFVGENSFIYHYDTQTNNYEEAVMLHTTTSSFWKDYSELPIDLIYATVAIEDKRFYSHQGFDWKRTAAAALYLFTGSTMQGGSTITQQLIKNLTNEDDITVKRKIIEIFRAMQVDAMYTKQEIITWYLNIIYLGDSNQGVGAASLAYFGKEVSELSLAECASLISITNNPTVYGPYSTVLTINANGEQEDGKTRNKKRQELVLYEMYMQDIISVYEYLDAVNEELVFIRSAEESKPVALYTWFEEQVIDDVRDDLMTRYGYSKEAADMMLSSGGLQIYTTYQDDIQHYVDNIYTNRNSLNIVSPTGQQMQSAITVIENATGDVVAMAGQMGVKSQNLLFNYASKGNRQPGSAIKPLSVYAPAFELGYLTRDSIVSDTAYMTLNGSAWPGNAYGAYWGNITLDNAIQNSSNAVAANIIGNMLGPSVSFDFMTQQLDFNLVETYHDAYGQYKTDRDIAPLALGGLTFGVNTRDMAEAYAMFANEGLYTYSRTYSKVLNHNGDVLLDNTIQQNRVISKENAYYLTDLLQGVITSGTGTAAQFGSMAIAGKTGTTNNKFDLWFVGYTPYYTAAVWTGYEYNEEINTTQDPAMDMWRKVMQPLHANLSYRSFPVPDTVR